MGYMMTFSEENMFFLLTQSFPSDNILDPRMLLFLPMRSSGVDQSRLTDDEKCRSGGPTEQQLETSHTTFLVCVIHNVPIG